MTSCLPPALLHCWLLALAFNAAGKWRLMSGVTSPDFGELFMILSKHFYVRCGTNKAAEQSREKCPAAPRTCTGTPLHVIIGSRL